MPHQPFKDQLAGHRRASLFVFYIAAILSTVATGLLQRLRDLRSMLLSLAIAGAACAVWCLLRFLWSCDEREQQIDYGALTFVFLGTLIFSLPIGFAQSIGFHSVSLLGISTLMVILCRFGLILYSWRYR